MQRSVCGPKGLMAFEVKRSSRLSKKDLNGLKIFHNDFPEAKLYLLYGSSREEYENGIQILSVEKALKDLPDILGNR